MSSTNAAQWLVEGGADWAEAGMRLIDAESSFTAVLAGNRNSAASPDAPPLDHTERIVGTWHYTLGALASHRLALRNGNQSLLEFWRMLLPEPLGPLGRWKSEPPWQDTFQRVFGFSVDTFYDDFASWRSRLSALSIRGRVVGPDGQGLPYIKVIGRSEASEDVPWYWDWSFTYTDPDGHFELPVSADAAVGVDLGDCEVYYSPQGLVSGLGFAPRMSPDSNGEEGVAIRLTDSTCVWQIHGQVLDADVNPLANIQVSAVRENGDSSSTRTKSDGSFAITVGEAGVFRVNVWIDGCAAYFRQGQAPGGRQQATLFSVQDGDVTGIRFQLTEGLCSTQISGRLLDADGEPLPNVSVSAWAEDGTVTGDQTDSDGSFAITVPESGQYRVYTWIDGCNVFYRRGGPPGSQQQATQVRVSHVDVTGIILQLTDGMCDHRISGTLLNADGSPRSGQWVGANSTAGYAGASTAGDGSFSFAVPGNGSYRLSVHIDGCSIYRGSRGPTKNWNGANQTTISNADVAGIVFRLPENPASFCN